MVARGVTEKIRGGSGSYTKGYGNVNVYVMVSYTLSSLEGFLFNWRWTILSYCHTETQWDDHIFCLNWSHQTEEARADTESMSVLYYHLKQKSWFPFCVGECRNVGLVYKKDKLPTT